MIIEKSDFVKKYPSLVMVCNSVMRNAKTTSIEKLTSTDIVVFYYMYDNYRAEILDINEVDIIEKVSLTIYKKTSASLPRVYAGFLRFPFDTQNAFNYLILKHLSKKSDNAAKELKTLYKDAQIDDLKRVKKIEQETNFKNTFDVYDRNSFVKAVNNYVYAPEKIKSILLSITDTLAGWFKTNRDKNLYGQVISKMVTLLPDGNGGIVRDGNYFSNVRFLFGGIRSYLVGVEADDSELAKKRETAVKLYRENVSIKDIYLQTGWFYNKFDSQWRFLIPDNKSKLTTWSETNNIFAVKGSRADGMKLEAYNNISRGDTGYCKKLLKDGWDCKLSDVLDHPMLYKHYEQLYSLPVFFIHTSASENYYYSPDDEYILICGNPKEQNLKSILLHETQHAIQAIEGYGSGGNLHFAKIVSSVGAEGLREFIGTLKETKNSFMQNWKPNGEYSYERFSLMFGRGTMSELQYYDDVNNILFFLVNNNQSPQVGSFLKSGNLEDGISKIHQLSKNGATAAAKLKAQGYSANQVSGILFSNYELLLGELESRNVQELENFDENQLSYFLPLTTEGYDEARVVVYTNSYGEKITMPTNTKAAIERTMNKYIIHIKQSNDIKPLLHELAHLVYDIIDPSWAEDIINSKLSLELRNNYKFNYEEIFCDLMLCYFASLNIDDSFTKRVIPNEKLMGFELEFVPKFNSMFQAENSSVTLQKLSQMNDFVKALYTETI